MLHELIRSTTCISNRGGIAITLDPESFYWLTGFFDSFYNLSGPLGLNTNHDYSSNVRITSCTNEGTEMQLQVSAKLQTTIGVGNFDSTLNVVGDRIAGGVREVIEGENNHMITNPHASVLTTVTHKSGFF